MTDAADTHDLGLFPLELVALPGETVPLHLFEPRYRQLYADCVLEDRPFVLVRSDATGTAEVGCATRFATLARRFADGRLSVICQGQAPVRLIEETEGRLYFSATVEYLVDRPSSPEPALAAEVLGRYRAIAGLPGEAAPPGPPGTPLSYAVAGALDVPAGAKQVLLESRDEGERLELVRRALADAEEGAAHARRAAARARTNGKVTAP